MNKYTLNKMDLDVYFEKLKNGLEIYIVPKKNSEITYVTFSTKYGSTINEFVPIDSKKMIKVPDGIAHFLEHKVFEQEDGTDPFSFFSERGADANASTSNYKTTYLFSGSNSFEENLEFLLDYVQKPYFTDKNVEKEKGIIKQEIKMYLDDPMTQLYEKSIYNAFIKHPIKIPVIGDIKSINSITKEDLYNCYNTFYNPSNMFVIITGNVDIETTFSIIENNQEKKEFKRIKKIETKEYNEPDKVEKNEEVLKMDVSIPKVAINYKLRYDNIKNINKRAIITYINLYFDILFGATSVKLEDLKKKKIVSDNIATTYVDTKSHILYMIYTETNKKEEFLSEVKNITGSFDITEEELERKKKVLLSSLIYSSDNIYSINNMIMNQIIKYNKIIEDRYKEIQKLNIKDFKTVINNLSFNDYNVVIIES